MEKIWVLALTLGLLAAFIIRVGPVDEPHTLEYDSELSLKLARQIIEQGSIPEKEPLRYAGYFEGGWDNREILPLIPYMIAGLSFGQESLVKPAAMWYPLISAMLTFLVVAYIGKELFGTPGLIAGAILGTLPGFVFRTAAGSCDKEAGAIFIMALGMYFYVRALKKRSPYLSTIAGLCFGISSMGWGGFFLFLMPISLFTLIQTLLGKVKDNSVFLFLLSSLFIPVAHNGLVWLNSYPNFVILGTAAYVGIESVFGSTIARTPLSRNITNSIKAVLKALGKPFNRIEVPESSIATGLLVVVLGMIGLYAIGRDPVSTVSSLATYVHNPFRAGIHQRSVAEQTAVSMAHWNSEVGVMKSLVFPMLGLLDPTIGLENMYLDITLMLLSSLPLLGIIYLLEPKWEYLFVAVWAFFSNFIAISAVRMFFPLMPAVAVAGAGVFAYLTSKKENRQLGTLIPRLFAITSVIVFYFTGFSPQFLSLVGIAGLELFVFKDEDKFFTLLILFFIFVNIIPQKQNVPTLFLALLGAALTTFMVTLTDQVMNYLGYGIIIVAFLFLFYFQKIGLILLIPSITGVAFLTFLFIQDMPFIRKAGYALALFCFIVLSIPSLSIAGQLSTSIDPYWYQGLTWYKHNSLPDSPLATWWDYGYWIFELADRPSLADGSNTYYPADVDLGKLFTYTNETDAINYLKAHDTNFVIMDGSMVPKFYWVSSIGFDDESKAITYPQFGFAGTSNTTFGMARIYEANDGTQLVAFDQGVIIGNQQRGYLPLDTLATENGYVQLPVSPNATSGPGAVMIASNMALYIPEEAEDILFTKLYILGGAGLEHFTPVFNNGYIKTYQADYA